MTVRWRGRHYFDRIGAGLIEGLPQFVVGKQYFVSALNGSDTNVGTSPEKPLATLARARTLNTADYAAAGYATKKLNIVWVEPGVYDEYFTGGFYFCWVVGLGIRGTDTQAEIHPSSVGGVFRGNATFLGGGFLNMRFESDIQDVPIFDLGICNNSKIVGCEFALGAGVTGVWGIDTENCTHLTVEDCDFTSGMANNLAGAIWNRGGANKYAHNVRYLKNRIFAATGGIRVANDCTASGAIAEENDLYIEGTGIGIDGSYGDELTGQLLAVKNRIIVAGAGDAIHGVAAGNMMHNETNVNGVFAYETA
jgi:hypothetical protein